MMTRGEKKELFALIACVVSFLGILAMARVCDWRERNIDIKLKEAEARNAALQSEDDACWKGFREELKKVIRFKCPDKKEDQ
jgi:hypothetical protein